MSNTVQYKCPNCGGDIKFSPEKQGYDCEWCTSFFTQEEIRSVYAELENADLSQNVEESRATDDFAEHNNLYVCNGCGAEVVADEQTSATFCCYCHSPVTLKGRLSGDYRPDLVMPFNVDRNRAESIFKDWCNSKWFTPSSFKSDRTLEKMTGLYVPFWLADCKTDSRMVAVGRKVKRWSDASFEYTKTDEYHVVRSADIQFTKVPADGEERIEDRLMEAIEPFDYSKLQPFSMSYLSGFYADKYDVDRAGVLPTVRSRVEDGAMQILKGDTHYDSLEVSQKDVRILQTDWKYALMPVWFLNCKYNDRFYTFVVNGQSGKVAGILPLSMPKLVAFGAVLTVVLTFVLSFLLGE